MAGRPDVGGNPELAIIASRRLRQKWLFRIRSESRAVVYRNAMGLRNARALIPFSRV